MPWGLHWQSAFHPATTYDFQPKNRGRRNFANKIWMPPVCFDNLMKKLTSRPLILASSKLRTSGYYTVNDLISELTNNLESLNWESPCKIYDFIWEEYCDWWEWLNHGSMTRKIRQGLKRSMSWTTCWKQPGLLPVHTVYHRRNMQAPGCWIPSMISSWPYNRIQLHRVLDKMAIIINIRHQEQAEAWAFPPQGAFVTKKKKQDIICQQKLYQKLLCFGRPGTGWKSSIPKNAASAVIPGAEVSSPGRIIDIDKEIERLKKKKSTWRRNWKGK